MREIIASSYMLTSVIEIVGTFSYPITARGGETAWVLRYALGGFKK